jgi:hypothetical protein
MRLLSLLLILAAAAHAEPRFASPEARALADRVLEAHGGLAPWRAGTTASFQYTMLFAPAKQWFNSFEMTDKATYRSYQDADVPEEGIIGWDGRQAWSVGIHRGEPPVSRINFHYTTLFLPWLMHQEALSVGAPRPGRLPGSDHDSTTVDVTFVCRYGCTTDGNHARYTVFINPTTNVIEGVQYFLAYGALLDLMGLPEGTKRFGPMTHVYSSNRKVEGLLVPKEYVTYNPEPTPVVYHLIHQLSFKRPFDEGRMKRPADAVVDDSAASRKKK